MATDFGDNAEENSSAAPRCEHPITIMKEGVAMAGSDAGASSSHKRFFGGRNPAEALSDQAKNLKMYASEVSEKISEKYLEIETRLKAYVGTIEDAEEHTIDNLYITRGYRINHNTCHSIFKSLFSCHNEFVNIWSHIIGVLVFLILLTSVWSDVLPNQFWYAYTLTHEFKLNRQQEERQQQVGSNGFKGDEEEVVNMADPRVFIDAKIAELLAYSREVQAMDLTDEPSESKMADFLEGVTEVMYRIEGISHFTIDNFYTFDYLDAYAQSHKPSFEQLT